MAAKKRQKVQESPKTLHHFFAAKPNLANSFTDGTKATTTPLKEKEKSHPSMHGRKSQTRSYQQPSLSHEVIVIDDSDDSDIELIEVAPNHHDAGPSRVSLKRERSLSVASSRSQGQIYGEGSTFLDTRSKPGCKAGSRSGVGLPVHLIAAHPERVSSKCAQTHHRLRSSSILERQGCTPPPPEGGALEPPPAPSVNQKGNQATNVLASSDGDEDQGWESGDDEREPRESEDDVVPFEEEDGDGDMKDSQGTGQCLGEILLDETESGSCCPLCNEPTFGWSQDQIQAHVNTCIDSLPALGLRPSTSAIPGPSKSTPTSKRTIPMASDFAPKPAPNAFSLLMSSRKESDAWKVAEMDHAKAGTEGANKRNEGGRRKAPFYKVMQGMPVAVDAFRYGKIPGVTAYFLTHAHSDHYTNLSSSWKNGPIYCSKTTANLIIHMLKVDPIWVKPIPENIPTVIPNTSGVEVTVIEANHCPGSSLFLFAGRQTVNAGDCDFPSPYVGSSKTFRYLHCGDFRASPRHALHPAIRDKKLDVVYLDTTYCDAKYCFPPQQQVIEACADLAKRIAGTGAVKKDLRGPTSAMNAWLDVKGKGKAKEETIEIEPPLLSEESTDDTLPQEAVQSQLDEKKEDAAAKNRTLVAVGTYSIGKERIAKAIAKALSSKIYCDSRKTAIFKCQDDPELHSLMTNDPYDAQVHVVPLQIITTDKIEPYFSKYRAGFSGLLGLRPTGWTYTPPAGTDLLPPIPQVIARNQSRNFEASLLKLSRGSTSKFKLYGVPYSEHSSFFELTCFALSVNAVKMIATVNVASASSRGKMQKWFDKWDVERRKRFKDGKLGVVPYRSLDYW